MIRDDRDSYQVRLVAVACLEYVVAAQTYPGRCLAAVVPACRDSRGSREVQGTSLVIAESSAVYILGLLKC